MERRTAAEASATLVGVPATFETTTSAAAARPRRRGRRLTKLLLLHGDVFALLIAFFGAHELGRAVGAVDSSGTHDGLFLLTLPFWLLGIKAAGLYDRDEHVIAATASGELSRLFKVATVGTWLFAVLVSLTAGGVAFRHLIIFWLLAVAFLPAVRAVVRWQARRDPAFPQKTVIIGAGRVGQLLGRKFLQHPEYHVNLLGFVDDQPRERRDDLDELTLVGRPEELPELIHELSIERIIIAFSNDPAERTLELVRLLQEQPVQIDVVPRLYDVIPPGAGTYTVEGIPLVALPRLHLSASARISKRALDITVASATLILLAPLFFAAALFIKLDTRGPVLFRQLRMGYRERPFWMYKFRTMTVDADERKTEVAHLNRHARPGGDPRMFKIPGDPRVTRAGRVLRRYSLDEFPQLINVLKGDMSLIGPRPLILDEDRFVESWARKRLLLKPGMTGLWQVLGRNVIPFEEMVKIDYLYLTSWSLLGDCQLLLKTVPLVLRGEPDGYQ